MKSSLIVWIPLSMALCSCAAPKATVVEESAAPVKSEPEVMATAAAPMPASEDDGIRLPDMLTLPDDGEFRAGVPSQPVAGGSAGAVIARPPTDPPSRPKPKDGE
jgi:hypothetical protein